MVYARFQFHDANALFNDASASLRSQFHYASTLLNDASASFNDASALLRSQFQFSDYLLHFQREPSQSTFQLQNGGSG